MTNDSPNFASTLLPASYRHVGGSAPRRYVRRERGRSGSSPPRPGPTMRSHEARSECPVRPPLDQRLDKAASCHTSRVAASLPGADRRCG